ncbi:sensor histidine kinase [Nocardia sp. NBC_01327]|uniref:sensor histidine kinase n=1 Tax=Nocardia sp. NBC_01327 TaxID=2903593 RepID=UPI002E0EBF22|nr:histidine kinase [Nocardia sp. NBC_01327]
MTTTRQTQEARPERIRDELVQPVLVSAMVVGTIVQLPYAHIVYPAVTLPLFALVAAAAIGSQFPFRRLSSRGLFAMMSTYMLLAALLLPLLHSTTTGALFPYVAASATGAKLASRKAAVGIAVTGAVIAIGAALVVEWLAPASSQWPWWVPLTVCLPVYIGIANRDRRDALHSAQRAAEEARRATDSEAREAALLERGRIAREVHDVLGHSLSGIALQLDLADALHESGRDAESIAAVRKARALAVDSIGETRRAVQALREDTVPLPDALVRLAEQNAVEVSITGEIAPVGPEATHTVIRAAQESLTNAAKHAPGAERTMRLAFIGERITLTVHNAPGDGPRGHLADGTGVGLIGMGERAALLGGTLRAGPSPEGGWTVELELPQ